MPFPAICPVKRLSAHPLFFGWPGGNCGSADLCGQEPESPLPIKYFWRAMISNMDECVRRGTPPPTSTYPKIACDLLCGDEVQLCAARQRLAALRSHPVCLARAEERRTRSYYPPRPPSSAASPPFTHNYNLIHAAPSHPISSSVSLDRNKLAVEVHRKTSKIRNRLAGLRANEQYHQMCG